MDYTTLQTRVAQEAGMDLTQDSSIVGAWVNGAYQHISGVFNWPWLIKTGTIQTVADITTGTVAVSAGGQALTFSSGPAVSVANDYWIQFTTSADWYPISAHTAASTSATISIPYVGTSAYSSTYILRKIFYSLPSDLDRVDEIRQAITKQKLEYIDYRTFHRYIADPTASYTPIYYSMIGLDASQYWRIGLYPTPNAVINLQLLYYQKITELSATSDTPLIPAKWHNVVVWGALALYGHDFIDDTRVQTATRRFSNGMEEMLAHYNAAPDQRTVIQPWDTRTKLGILPIRFPSDFPEYYGR